MLWRSFVVPLICVLCIVGCTRSVRIPSEEVHDLVNTLPASPESQQIISITSRSGEVVNFPEPGAEFFRESGQISGVAEDGSQRSIALAEIAWVIVRDAKQGAVIQHSRKSFLVNFRLKVADKPLDYEGHTIRKIVVAGGDTISVDAAGLRFDYADSSWVGNAEDSQGDGEVRLPPAEMVQLYYNKKSMSPEYDGLRRGLVVSLDAGFTPVTRLSTTYQGVEFISRRTAPEIAFSIGCGITERGVLAFRFGSALYSSDYFSTERKDDNDLAYRVLSMTYTRFFGPAGSAYFVLGGLGKSEIADVSPSSIRISICIGNCPSPPRQPHPLRPRNTTLTVLAGVGRELSSSIQLKALMSYGRFSTYFYDPSRQVPSSTYDNRVDLSATQFSLLLSWVRY